MTVLRYEDMLDDPVACFTTVIRELGAPDDAGRIAAAVAASSFAEARKQESAGGFIEKPPAATRFFRSGRSGEGRAVLPAATIDAVIEAHGPVMEKFGYQT